MSQDTTGSTATAAASSAHNGQAPHVEALENLLPVEETVI